MEMEDPVSFEPREHSAPGVLSSALAAIAGFAVIALIGVRSTPGPEDFPITPKLAHLTEHIAEYDAVIIGRSHVFRSFVPQVIDAELARLGKPLRTFNLGGPGMSDTEIDHVLRTVLDMKGQHLSTIFIEVPDWAYALDENTFTDRAIAAHTVLQTTHVLRTLWLSDLPWLEFLQEVWTNLRMLGQHLTAFGQGKRILAAWRSEIESQPITPEAIVREYGYQALDDLDLPEITRRRKKFLANRAGYVERVKKIIEGNQEQVDLGAYNREALLSQIALMRAAGVEPVYIVPPSMDATPIAFALREAGLIPNLLAFNDPKALAGIYRFEKRFDSHLTRAGAEEFSLIFARSYVRLE